MMNAMCHRFRVGSLVTIVVLCISATVVNALQRSNSTAGEVAGRIVGGQQAAIGEYPYFVSTRNGGCGGVLIASEWVLTAVHCGDIINQEVLVGPYQIRSSNYDTKRRTCTYFKRDPAFENSGGTLSKPNAPFKNDAALCKLDTPVYIDDSEVSFQLNDKNSYPSTGLDVVAIGFGTTSSGGSQPTFIRDVTVKVDSNSACAAAPSSIYNSQTISKEIICASVNRGGKDACQGDSGGPLVRRATIDGKRTDFHVGITSWGVGCAEASLPGVYSRTSYSYNFIRNTICSEGNSPSPFCQTSSLVCNSNQEKLVIRLVTDAYPGEVTWKLTKNGSGWAKSKSNFNKQYMTYEESYCLEKASVYRFVIDDGYGDGLTNGEKGFYSLTLDGKEKARGSDYGDQDVKEIRTQVQPTRAPTKRPTRTKITRGPCSDDNGYRFQNQNCSSIFKGKGRRREKCHTKDPQKSQKKIRYFCPTYCKKKCGTDRSGGNTSRQRKRRPKKYKRAGKNK